MMQESGVPEDGPLLGTRCWDTCSLASPDSSQRQRPC